MTLHTHTVHEYRCDGRLNTACDASHPDRPHTCPATITYEDHGADVQTKDVMRLHRWSNVIQDGHERHYCPAHREQGLPRVDVSTYGDCEAKGWSGEGRCVEPADGLDGLCTAHRAHTPGVTATPHWDDDRGKQHQSPG